MHSSPTGVLPTKTFAHSSTFGVGGGGVVPASGLHVRALVWARHAVAFAESTRRRPSRTARRSRYSVLVCESFWYGRHSSLLSYLPPTSVLISGSLQHLNS